MHIVGVAAPERARVGSRWPSGVEGVSARGEWSGGTTSGTVALMASPSAD